MALDIKVDELASNLKGIVFDLDNTLLSSRLDFGKIRTAINCPKSEDIIAFIDKLPEKKLRDDAMACVIAFEIEDALYSSWLEQAKETLDFFALRGLKMAIVTRNCRDAALLKMRENQVPIDLLLSREDAPPKPAPDALLMVASQWDIDPNHLAYVGDYKYDVDAANNAGMLSVLLAEHPTPDYAHSADLVFHNWAGVHQYFAKCLNG